MPRTPRAPKLEEEEEVVVVVVGGWIERDQVVVVEVEECRKMKGWIFRFNE